MNLLACCCLASILVSAVTANLQAWSVHTYLNKPYTISCNVTNGNLSVNADDKLSWTKLGSETELETDEYYQLLNVSGVTNMSLKIRSVTSEMAGIYFCHVRDKNGEYIRRVVTGVNIAGHLYDDKFDEYRTDVIRGVISAATVFGLVVGVCVIDRFRFLTDEQKQKRRERKQDRLRRLQQSQNGGVDNLAMQDGLYNVNVEKSNGSHHGAFDSNTHL